MKTLAPILLVAVVTGCARSGPATNNVTAAAPNAAAPSAPVPPPLPVDEPGNTAAAATPADPNSAEAAAQLVERYFALIEAHNYAGARRLWGDDGASSNMSESAFAASFQAYEAYHAEVGAPGEPEGAAGSIFVEVPVQVSGRRNGRPFLMPGSVTVRRVNDVPGSTAAQRRWHIESVQLQSQA